MTRDREGITRRLLLRRGVAFAGLAGAGLVTGLAVTRMGEVDVEVDWQGPLEPPDENGLRLLPGYEGRVIAVSGREVAATGHTWHGSPDGGATFATDDGGWIYVSNSERLFYMGGVGAIRFDASGTIVDAYSILTGSDFNCAGGATPWGTWLSCEESGSGRVFECDPYAPGSEGSVVPALGVFRHEAVAVDPVAGVLYLTEDEVDGLLYRFTPSSYPSLTEGVLEAATIGGSGAISPGETRSLDWSPVADPSAARTATREQVPAATAFNGGEGCSYQGGFVYFTTKGDDRVWRITTATQEIEIFYDRETSPTPLLSGVDNVLAASNGDVFVAEDPGDLQVVLLDADGLASPIAQVVGHWGSEITGPALSPDGSRLYFSSQRNPGMTFEVKGPFLDHG